VRVLLVVLCLLPVLSRVVRGDEAQSFESTSIGRVIRAAWNKKQHFSIKQKIK
jgi:hypothetical protein